MTEDDYIHGITGVAATFVVDSLRDRDDECATVLILQRLNAIVLAHVMLSLHRKGDRILDLEDARHRVTLLLSAMAPDTIEAAAQSLGDFL